MRLIGWPGKPTSIDLDRVASCHTAEVDSNVYLPHSMPQGNNRSQPWWWDPHHVWCVRRSLATDCPYCFRSPDFPRIMEWWAQSVDLGSANWRTLGFFAPKHPPSDRELNLRPVDCKSDAQPIAPLHHPEMAYKPYKKSLRTYRHSESSDGRPRFPVTRQSRRAGASIHYGRDVPRSLSWRRQWLSPKRTDRHPFNDLFRTTILYQKG